MKNMRILLLFSCMSMCGVQGQTRFDVYSAEDKYQDAVSFTTSVTLLALINVLQMKISNHIDFKNIFFGEDEHGRGFLKRLFNDKETAITTLRVSSSVLFPLLAYYVQRKAWTKVVAAREKAKESSSAFSALTEDLRSDKAKIKRLITQLQEKSDEKAARLAILSKNTRE
ncbi:MAG: hypothetical protein QG632_447 [Candidatus Dependentiae bacterium]|nr:hypothetical protein [Candidatus Dependentiae bacterium]